MHIIPSFLVDKASCTRQFESELSLHSPASLFPIKEGIFSNPSVSLSKGSSTSNQAFSIVFTTPSVPLVGDRNLRRKDVTALLGARNRYAIRLAGHQSPRHVLRDGTAWGINNDGKATSQLQRRHYSIPSLQKFGVVSLL